MKKKSFLILLPALMMVLASCNETSSDTSSSTTETTDTGSGSGSETTTSSEETKTGTVTIENVEHGSVTADKMTAKVGETVTFTITTDENYEVDTFKVNDKDVSVNDGIATSLMVEEGLKAKLTVKQTLYSVTINETKNGKVTADKTSAVVGENVTFTVKADEEFEVDTFKVNDKDVSLNNEGKATVAMVKDGLTVDATFKAIKHAVNIDTSIANGTVTADKTTAANGEVVTFIVTPNDDYELATFKVNGADVTVSNNKATYTMGKVDITATATFTQIKHKVTIDSKITNGKVIANKTEAVTGEDVILTITPDTDFHLEQLTVNDTPVTVTGDTVTVQMIKGGITVSATFTDFVTVSSIDEAFISEVEGKDVAKYKLADDLTADHLPVAKKTTVIDLNGKTLTISSNKVLWSTKDAEQDITIQNGKIIVNGASEKVNFFGVGYANTFTMNNIALSNTNDMADGSAVIHCSDAKKVVINNSTINAKTVFGVSVNNLEGLKNALDIEIVKSNITVSLTSYDTCALVVNVNTNPTIKIEDSTLVADRQALLARTGSYTVKNSTLEITDKWLSVEANKTTNDAYLAGSWKGGNEVPSTPLCAGDTNAGAYNGDVNVTLDNVTTVSSLASHIVAREDGTYKTTLNVDALTYLDTYQKTDISESVTLNASNVKFLTIKEMNALTTTDANNLYVVSGNIKEISNTTYGNGTLVDEDGTELIVYGSYTTNTPKSNYSYKDGTFSFDKTGATALDKTYAGKEVTMIGTFEYYAKKSTPEIINAITFIEDVIATVTTNVTGNGSVQLSKTTDIHVGEKITVTVTPDDGYKLASVKVTMYGTEYDITDDLTFVAAKSTKVDVVFVDESLQSYTITFNKTNNSAKTSSYSSSWSNTSDGITYNIYGFNNNNNGWEYVKGGKNSTITTATAFANKIGTVVISIDEIDSKTSATLLVASDKDFKNDLQEITINAKKGKVTTTVTTPSANQYYQIKIVGTDNKSITISKVVFNEVH